MHRSGISWTTNHEIDFLMKIGTFGQTQKDPVSLLKSYIRAAKYRKNWNHMDKKRIIKTAKAYLAILTKK